MIFDEVSRSKDVLSVEGFKEALENRQAMDPGFDTDRADEDAILQSFLNIKQLPTYAQVEEILTDAALRRTDGNQTLAARMLGISQPGLSKRLNARKQDEQK
jgi:DNA-binding NtrC family response regulator